MIEAVTELPVVVRPLSDGDHALILSSWLRNNVPDPRIDKDVYFKRHEIRIKSYLTNAPKFFRVLSDTDDPDHIYGWVCADADYRTLHFVYVKSVYRRQGFANRLLRESFESPVLFHTHESPKLEWLALNSTFDPYAFFQGAEP